MTDAVGLTERLAASLENTRRDMTRATLEAVPEVTPEPMPEPTPEVTPEATVQATLEATFHQAQPAPGQAEDTVPARAAARPRRKAPATPRRISDTDLKELIRPLFER